MKFRIFCVFLYLINSLLVRTTVPVKTLPPRRRLSIRVSQKLWHGQVLQTYSHMRVSMHISLSGDDRLANTGGYHRWSWESNPRWYIHQAEWYLQSILYIITVPIYLPCWWFNSQSKLFGEIKYHLRKATPSHGFHLKYYSGRWMHNLEFYILASSVINRQCFATSCPTIPQWAWALHLEQLVRNFETQNIRYRNKYSTLYSRGRMTTILQLTS